MCEHDRRGYRCKECPPSRRVGRCEHNRVFAQCRICNENHPFHGVLGYHGRGSDFEDLVIRSILAFLPPDCTVIEQFPIKRPEAGARDFLMDLYVRFPDGLKVGFEADGSDHYDMVNKRRLSNPEEQLRRDRYKEKYCLYNDISIFRIPYTMLKSMDKMCRYVQHAIKVDREEGISKVHYLDYARSYAKINEFVEDGDGNEELLVHQCEQYPYVYIADSTSLDFAQNNTLV